MKPHADIRRLTVARRLACNLPVWVVARGSNMTVEAVEALMAEWGFDELIASMAQLMAMDEQERLKKLYQIAQETLAAAVIRRDERASEFMIAQWKRGRNPHRTLQRGLNKTFKAEMARSERTQAEIDAGRLTPDTPLPEKPEPFDFSKEPRTLAEAVAMCEAALALPPDRHIDRIDARVWRKAGALRREMLQENLLHHVAAEHEAAQLRKVPMEIEEVDAIEAAQVAYRRAVVAQEKENAAKAEEPKAPEPKPKVRAPEPASSPEPGLSPLDMKALDEIRAMYRLLPPERLAAMCRRPPRGMEKLFAILAREIGVEPGQPQGP